MGFLGVWTPRGLSRHGTPADLPSGRRKLWLQVRPPARACGSFRLSAARAAAGRLLRPVPGSRGLLARWGRAAGAGRGAPHSPGECPDSSPVLSCPARWTVSSSEAGSRSGFLCLPRGSGCSGAPGPRGTSPLRSSRPPPELVLAVLGDLGFSFSVPERGRCRGRTRPLLLFQRLLCIQLLHRGAGDSGRRLAALGGPGWQHWEAQGPILPSGALWVLGCSEHLAPP